MSIQKVLEICLRMCMVALQQTKRESCLRICYHWAEILSGSLALTGRGSEKSLDLLTLVGSKRSWMYWELIIVVWCVMRRMAHGHSHFDTVLRSKIDGIPKEFDTVFRRSTLTLLQIPIEYRVTLRGEHNTNIYCCKHCSEDLVTPSSMLFNDALLGFAELEGDLVIVYRCPGCFEVLYHHVTDIRVRMFLEHQSSKK